MTALGAPITMRLAAAAFVMGGVVGAAAALVHSPILQAAPAAQSTDELAALKSASRRYGTVADGLDFALLLDGLEAEREQGITIDVAYRFFETDRRRFIVADAPGHEQYTRNMATGASNADLAVLLVDAQKGLTAQTCRHAYIVSLLGIRHVVLAVNKIDLIHHDRARFDAIAAQFYDFISELGFVSHIAIPPSARFGENITTRSPAMPWYAGPTLLEHLETIDANEVRTHEAFRFPVQWVNRPDSSFRGYAGTIAGGTAQGLGGILLEDIAYDPDGQLLAGSLADYMVPTAGDMPEMVLVHQHTPSPLNPLGVKGVGEGGAVAPPAAIANAIADALAPFGAEFNTTPIKPEQIVKAVRSALPGINQKRRSDA